MTKNHSNANNTEELYETETEDKFSHDGEISQTSEGSTEEENEEFHMDLERRSASELPIVELDASVEVVDQEEMSQKAFLDSVFGELPPKSLIKTNLLFPKPPPPPQRPQTKQTWFFTKVDVADEERSQDITSDDLQKDEKLRKPKKRFVRIGGMLVIPVPVEGPLFADQEINYGNIVLYDKYIPELDCYRAAQKHYAKLSFPLDFAKPGRPGTQRRSKPSDLKRKPGPLPVPEPPVLLTQPQEPPEDAPPPKQSFFDKLCSVCCCCCAPRQGKKEASAESTAQEEKSTADETNPPSTAEMPQEPTIQIQPKPRKGILKASTSMEQKSTPSKSISTAAPETEKDNTPPLSPEPLASATPDANISTDFGPEEESVTSFTATTTVVAVVSEPLTTIFRCDEISSVIDTSISHPTSERTELRSDIHPCGEASSLPATSLKLEEHSPVLTSVSEPDKVAEEHPAKETKGDKCIPTEPPAASLPEPTTDTSPSQPTSEKTEQGSVGVQFTTEAAGSSPVVPSRSVPPRLHKAPRRYFTLSTPEALPQKKNAGKKTAPLPGPNWIHTFL